MSVRFQMINSDSTAANLPTNAANTVNVGINAPGGAYEYIVCKFDLTYGAAPTERDFFQLVQSMRIIINGEVVHDFRSTAGNNTTEAPSQYAYLLNSIGGRAYELPGGATTRTGYIGIPLGRNYPQGVNRIEIVTAWKATAGAVTSGTVQWWLKTNPAFQKTTTVVPSTSYNHSATIEQVVVRVPQNVPGVVSAILVQNDAYSDQLGAQGIRIEALSSFGLEASMWRWMNGDLSNGIMYANNQANPLQQTFDYQVPGTMLIPCFGLAGGDIVLQVDSSAVTTRTYTPIITSANGGKDQAEVRQTQRATSNTAQAIVSRTEN